MWILAIAIASILVGCGSKLKIYDVDPKEPNQHRGIRVHEAVSYVVTKKIKTEKCPERIEDSIVHLPVGAPYDINVEPGLFAKSEFSVQFSDSGALKQVALNSTPQVAETINAVANLAEKVGKIAAPAAPVGARDCGGVTAETIESVRRLQLQ